MGNLRDLGFAAVALAFVLGTWVANPTGSFLKTKPRVATHILDKIPHSQSAPQVTQLLLSEAKDHSRILDSLSLQELKEAYLNRLNQYEKVTVDSRFLLGSTEDLQRSWSADLFRVLAEQPLNEAHWHAQYVGDDEGKKWSFEAFFRYYQLERAFQEVFDLQNIRDSRQICWSMTAFVGSDKSREKIVDSRCAPRVRSHDGKLYTIAMLSSGEMSTRISHFAMELPRAQNFTGDLEWRDAKTGQWTIASSGILWSGLSQVDADKLEIQAASNGFTP